MSRYRTQPKKTDDSKAEALVREVLNEDFPSIEIEAMLGYQSDEENDAITGQFVEKGSQIVYNFTFGKDRPHPVLQRFI